MSDCCNEFEFTSPQGTFYMDGGIRGKDGVTFYPHVSAAGILSWTNDGGKTNPDPVNIKGEDGKSAYAAAQEAGFTGTEQEFNAYLSGIGELTEDVDDLKSAFNADLVPLTWTPNIVRGSFYRVTDGAVGNSAKYARTFALWKGYGTRKAIVVDDPTYEFCLTLYDETGDTTGSGYQGYVGYTKGIAYIPQNAKLFGISFRRTDNASLANSDITAISAALSAFAATDTTLSVAGASADAKATGDRLAENREIINAHSVQQSVSIENAEKKGWWINQSGVVASSSKTKFFSIPCLENTLYRIDHPQSGRFIVGCFSAEPQLGDAPYIIVTGASGAFHEDSSFIVTDSASRYLGIYYYNSNYTEGYSESEAYAALAVYTNAVDSTLEHEGIAADAKAVGAIAKNRNYFAVADDTMLAPTFDGVIGLYDALVSLYPDFVTKNTLTTGTFTNYEYVLTIGNYNTAGKRTRDAIIAKPKVLVSAGMHGYERSAVMSLYKFIKSMCENAYDLDDVIYFCEMHIIPVICPWGYTNDSRLNENGVDLNHNFDNTTWTADSTSGSAPADQPETQIVQNWINANTDAKIYIDWHNSSFTDEISVLLGADTESNRKIKLNYLHGIDKVIPYWQKERGITASNIYGYTGTTGPGGTAKGYGAEKGLNSFTFETSWNIKSTGKHSAFSIGTGAEAMGNLIKGIRELFL